MNKTYTITSFAKALGVCVSTVRNYQKKGILADKRNPANNYRIFTEGDLIKAKNHLAPISA